MPQYKTHTQFNLLLALPLLIWGAHSQLHLPKPHLITFGLAFAYGTLFMNPDLDLAHKIQLFSIRGILSLPFRAYSKVFRHRGLSHSLVFGTLTRVGWLLMIAWVITFAMYKVMLSYTDLLSVYYSYESYFFYGFIGIFLADICHVALDHTRKS